MPFCAAFGCSNKLTKDCGLSFHKFPRDEPRRSQWIQNIRRVDFKPSAYSSVCSAHFTDESFDMTGQTCRLRGTAVPTIFNIPSHLQKVKRERTAPKRRPPSDDGAPGDSLPSISSPPPPAAGFYLGADHSYSITSTTQTMKWQLLNAEAQAEDCQRKLHVSQEQRKKLKRSVETTGALLDELKQKRLLSDSSDDILRGCFSGIPLSLMQRASKRKSDGKPSRRPYNEELRKFAMTLQFFSTRAYKYVRDVFNLELPHISTIRQWLKSVDGSAGFTQQMLNLVSKKVEEEKSHDRSVLCALMLDSMAIRAHIECDGSRIVGFVDFGTEVEDDSLPLAKDALVFMLVALDRSWKLPIGYFLISGLTGKELANLVRQAVTVVTEVGVKVVSLTCDGRAAHFAMLQELGADLDPPNMQPYFIQDQEPKHMSNLSSTDHHIYIMLDSCHMLKLMRNRLVTDRTFYDIEGCAIEWKYIEFLHEVQQDKGLHLASKLQKKHVDWKSMKIKVNVAAQTLSSSVANALTFCRENLGLPQFRGSEATCNFLVKIDKMFNILNSRNSLGKGYKAPLRARSDKLWQSFLIEMIRYLEGLRSKNGMFLIHTNSKIPVVGFLTCIRSVIEIYKQYVCGPQSQMSYLLTYKLSQDHLQLFFAALRARGGGNNNPTVRQFVSGYKRLLMRHKVKVSSEDCTAFGPASATITAETVTNNIDANVPNEIRDMLVARRYGLDSVDEDSSPDKEVDSVPDTEHLDHYHESSVTYISGFIVHQIRKKLKCPTCVSALTVTAAATAGLQDSILYDFVDLKDRGGLIQAAPSVVKVCRLTEKAIKKVFNTVGHGLPKSPYISTSIGTTVLASLVDMNLFAELDHHFLETEISANHFSILIQAITAEYVKVRFHHAVKFFTTTLSTKPIHKNLTKLIFFHHQ